jgi:hypothetical protein
LKTLANDLGTFMQFLTCDFPLRFRQKWMLTCCYRTWRWSAHHATQYAYQIGMRLSARTVEIVLK